MTKAELIELLKDVPDDAIILLNGHGDGCDFNDLTEVSEGLIVYKYLKRGWSGTYHKSFTYCPEGNNGDPIIAYCLS